MAEPDKLDETDELDKLDEQKQQEWQASTAQQRLGLSKSVEETLADTSLLEEDWLNEEDELDSPASDKPFVDESEEQANVKDTRLIPPRLSLQSKPMPIVRPDTPVQPSEPSPLQPSSQQPQQPSTVEPLSSNPRLAGRTTKVLLKAISRSEEVPQTGETAQSPPEETAGVHVGVIEQAESESEAKLLQVIAAMLFGSGVFKLGECDVMIDNPHVTRSSVIVVMLTSNPGPVVVQYVTLHPRVGFTAHLSAPAEREASFNYVILLEELP